MNISDSPGIAAAPHREESRPALGATARMSHPSAATLCRFARGRATREESRRVVSHLLGVCPACGEAISCAARLTKPEERD